jgi:hypothetical protein
MALIEEVLELKTKYEKKVQEIIIEFINDPRNEVPMLVVQRFKTRVATRLKFIQELDEIIKNNTLDNGK